ncbi:MAG TPA: glucose-6-phosphate isomerase [Candidatus Polarisedimenticolaceae bacterium]|nr:glucose-6-phosphate isomerase [Candidatus Polarisedimenticolaceae bacterium]
MTAWDRYRRWLYDDPGSGFRLDVSRMDIPEGWEKSYAGPFSAAFDAMEALERGAIANPDEGRMVGHYWLRAPELAPTQEIAAAIRGTLTRILAFADGVHRGRIRPDSADRFTDLLTIGIGGSALGPQFVGEALGSPANRLEPHFLDNTDPDGFDRLFARMGPRLRTTLTVVISKSGGTPETRNGMLEAAAAYAKRGLAFGPHAVAITQEGSRLDRFAVEQSFLERFPMWDWVGGRTSETSAVGLLPAALQGIDVEGMLAGAAAMDRLTRVREVRGNPAALLALAWHHAGGGRGSKDMVILPYKDRLALLSRYLQQLVMESLGKERDLSGRVVHQGIAVYGNKGSTDQHAYVQQLREGIPNFFATFVEVLKDRDGGDVDVEPGITSGDFLSGFLQGTRRALHDNGRSSLTITIGEVTPMAVGMLIALYERAVGLYASLVGVNAYHQPGVEAGKKAAASVLALQAKLVAALAARGQAGATAEALAADAGAADEVETAFVILEHLAANPSRGVGKVPGATPFDAVYRSL